MMTILSVILCCAGIQGLHLRFRGDAGAAPAEEAAAGRARPQVRVRMVQINLRALLQLAVMAIILYQVTPQPLKIIPCISEARLAF